MSRIGGTTRASRTWKETVAKEDKCVRLPPRRPSRVRVVVEIPRSTPRARRAPPDPPLSPSLLRLSFRTRRITKKSETCFFDRDKARWVEWEKEAETVKEVIGEDAPGAAAAAAAAKKRFPATKARIFNAVD
jgi:hypothetical protein